MYIFRLFILASIFLLASCGGGGGSSGSGNGGSGSKTSITVNPGTLEFTTNVNSSSTAKSVNVSFKGDGMIVGYPVGSVDPGWLTVDVSESYSSPVTVNIQAHSFGMPAGTHRTTLRFVTGKEDGTNIVYKDVPVTMVIEEGASIVAESLSFTSLESVPSVNKSFNISTKSAGDWSLSVQYSGTETNWLTLSQSSGSLSADSSTSVAVSTKGIKQGEHTATIVLKNKSGSVIDTLNISYQVSSGITVGNAISKAITEKANIEDLQWSIPIQSLYDPAKGSTINWTLTSDKDWLKVVSVAGNLGNTQNLQLELDADKLLMLENGNQSALVSIKFNDANITDFSVPVNLVLNIDAKLTITGYLGFTLDNDSTDASLEKTVQVGSNVGSAFSRNINWHVVVQSDWLKAVNITGNTTSQNSLTLRVEKSYLSTFKGNLDSAFISIIPDNPDFKHYAELAALQLYLPRIDSVTPYVGYTNQSGPLLISGTNFGLKSKWKIDFGGYLVDALVVDNNTLRVDYPPIATPQTLKLNIPNALNLDKSTPNFLIKDPHTYVTHKIETDKLYERIVLDAERDAIILSGSSANQITRYKYENSLWSSSFYPMAFIQNAELSVDGKEILVAVGTQNSADSLIQLNADDLGFKNNSVISSELYNEFSIILPLANSKTLIMDKYLWNDALIFPALSTINAPSNLSGWISAYMPRNRERFIVVGDRGAFSFKASGNSYVDCPIIFPSASYPYIMSMSTDSSRIVANTTVYGADCNVLGSLYPIPNNVRLVAVAPDGKHVYVYHYLDPYYNWNQNTPVIKRYDISSSSGTFLEDAGDFNYVIDPKDYPVDMEVSDDGRALFLLTTNSDSGLSSIYIIPLTN